MRKISFFVLILFTILVDSSCSSQNTYTIEDYYLNSDFFNIDTTYNNVLIDGKSFKVNVLSDKLNEHLEKIKFSEDEFENSSPKTIVIYNEANKLVYAKKMDTPITRISLTKQSGSVSKEGKLYLNWMSSGGGSGFSSSTNLVFLEQGKIKITNIFNSGEMDYILFNKNNNEIYVLKGIWNDSLNENGDPIETHFSEHRYKVVQYRFGNGSYEEVEMGVTKNKYSSLDDGISGKELLQLIITGEDFMPENMMVSHYMVFDNYNCKIIQ
jgi:hypothetical protein